MKAQLRVDDVIVLENGKVIVAVTILNGDRVTAKMVGRTQSGDVAIEVVSVALVNSPPAAPNKQGLHVRLLEGNIEALREVILIFE
jgi:hypothetical protein